MAALATVLAIALAVSDAEPAASAPVNAPVDPTVRDAIADAERLYRKGSAHYEAADYTAAITTWTDVLSSLPDSDEVLPIRLDLLYNIGVAHEKAYAIDKDPRHLRQAKQLFASYAETRGDDDSSRNALQRAAKIEELLATLDPEAEPDAAPVVDATPSAIEHVDAPLDRRSRNLGIGLTTGGGAALVGGVVVLALGARMRPLAQDQVAELDALGVPADHPARAQGDAFVAAETRKGRTMMALGGSLAGAGAVLAGVGIFYVVKSRGRRSIAVAPTLSGIAIKGRF